MNNKKLIKKQYLKSVNLQNSRKWSTKRQTGGELSTLDLYQQMLNSLDAQLRKYSQLEELKQKRMEQLHEQRIQQALLLGSQIGNIIGLIGGGLSNLSENTNDKNTDVIDKETEENIKEQTDEVNLDILEQSKKQLESWKMDDAKVMESLKLPVINSDEILGNDFLEMLNKLKTK